MGFSEDCDKFLEKLSEKGVLKWRFWGIRDEMMKNCWGIDEVGISL